MPSAKQAVWGADRGAVAARAGMRALHGTAGCTALQIEARVGSLVSTSAHGEWDGLRQAIARRARAVRDESESFSTPSGYLPRRGTSVPIVWGVRVQQTCAYALIDVRQNESLDILQCCAERW